MIRSSLVLIAAVLGLAGCGEPAPKVDTRQAAPIPEEQCKAAEDALEGLKAQLVLVYASDGSATMPEEAWMAQDPAARDTLVRTLALNASCKSQQPLLEKEVTIRGETGMVLERRTIDMAMNPAALEGQ